MKKELLLIFILIGLTSCNHQSVKGIWMSSNDRIINRDSFQIVGNDGIIIDFDKSEIGHITSDSFAKIEIDYKNMQFKNNLTDSKVDFEIFGKDSIEAEFGVNRMSVFKPLKFNSKLKVSKNEISEFLTSNCFQKIRDDLKVEFSNELYSDNKNGTLKTLLSTYSNNRQSYGYWGIKEIEKNYFLFFKEENIYVQNIYKIVKVEKDKIILEPIQEIEFNLTELKTCL